MIQELTNLLDSKKKPYVPKRRKPNVIMFVGLQGSGKTTTVTKLAYHYRIRGWKVGMICADTFRAGAYDQLRQNATKAKIPYYGEVNESDPVKIAIEGVKRFKEKKFEIIIVDTSGRHKQEESLFEEMEAINKSIKPDDIIFVIDSTIGQQAYPQALAFKERVNVGSVIVTKLDGHAKGGGALSAVAATQAPIIFIGVGEHMNELQKFNTNRFIKRILGRGDILTLVEDMKEQNTLGNQKQLVDKIKKGVFTLRMMQEQFKNILKMGSFSNIMQMIPGLSNALPKEGEEASQKRLQNFLYLMDSMTAEELDSPDINIIALSASRQRRISRGSGVHPNYIKELINVYKPFEQAVKKMKKLPFGKDGQLPKNMMQNPNQMGQFANMIPQNVLKQMGGQQGFMNLMQRFQNAEKNGQDPMSAMSGMQSMMKNMKRMQQSQRRRRR